MSTYVTKTPGELVPGEIAYGPGGLLCLVTDAPKLSKSHPGERTFWTKALVLNRAEISGDSVPYSFTTPRLGNGYADTEAIARGEHRWTFQGNDLARVAVLMHGPYREGMSYFT